MICLFKRSYFIYYIIPAPRDFSRRNVFHSTVPGCNVFDFVFVDFCFCRYLYVQASTRISETFPRCSRNR